MVPLIFGNSHEEKMPNKASSQAQNPCTQGLNTLAQKRVTFSIMVG